MLGEKLKELREKENYSQKEAKTMRIYKKVLSPRGIHLGDAAWTSDHKPGVIVKKTQHNFYDVVYVNEIERQVYEVLGIK